MAEKIYVQGTVSREARDLLGEIVTYLNAQDTVSKVTRERLIGQWVTDKVNETAAEIGLR